MMLRVLLGLLLALPAQAGDWGRLFYSEQERREGVTSTAQPAENSAKAPEVKRFDGELQTPRGKVHWVNGERATPPAGVKPGETWKQ